MEPWIDSLLTVWAESIDELAAELLAYMDRDPAQQGKWDLDTLRQVMQGGIAMIRAEYLGQGTEIREAYLQSVLPGIFEHGGTLAMQCGATMVVALRMSPPLIQRVPSEYQEKASEFLCHCYGKYMDDLVRVGIDVLNGKVT